ncbi:nitrilase-related carbon-nitrogen hydrolase [Streptomyces sp. NPDC051453]|uniref:nitrilase-related carbon-nitrogen hydrolase n=1 Tax=Streptomyces sp. NPDC051453 TaxID=3154941 RepID=UPI00343A790E
MTSASPNESRRTMTVAVAQAAAPLFDTPAALARAEEVIREADRRGAEVVVLPEAFLGGLSEGTGLRHDGRQSHPGRP